MNATFFLNSYDALDSFLLGLTAAEVDYPFGPNARVYRVLGKMFALVGEGGPVLTVNLKGPPEMNQMLVRDFEAITPGYHMNKQHWITVTLDGSVEDALLEELAAQSHEIVVASLPRKQREAYRELYTERDLP
ncbi:MmcQ/YjbR family DNA-binding protein [Lysinibacter sp. HNR]|uniref:MmcQ/YjbR family DNA-binding protein n=1 Tax=Lysinibacter sp. HNR TaxID=3031408 RepID=UPI00243560A9|nr:MmcQ/YjbR family DNA-binding protein [Lysinibacter sp. HNR]WGD37746.1 MmcQ/YjbR family DNA-binding protein [Lysinibacter sp. HNR]